MLFIDFSCLSLHFIYGPDQYWKKFWIDMAVLYPNITFKLVAEEGNISLPNLPSNCEWIPIKIKKLSGFFAGSNAFANAVKPFLEGQNAVWITNQITHMPDSDIQQLLWVDELEWLKFPQWQFQSREEISRKDWQKRSKKLKHFASFSKHYAHLLNNDLDIPETSINIFAPFYDNDINPASWAEKESIKTEYCKGNDFFVFAGDIHNRHHIISLLKAYSIFKKWQKSSMQLVIMGNTTEHSASILQVIESYKHRDDVLIITDPDEQEKLKILSAAYACLYTAESISLPITMPYAMKVGVPLIVSDIPNMREWGLDHVLYANAADETQIAEKMILLFKDETFRTLLVENATHFVQILSVDKSPASLLAMLHSLFPANFAATIK